MTEAAPQHARLEGISEYIAAIDAVLAQARHAVRVFDSNLEGIGFDSRVRYELLKAFLLQDRGNRLHIVVHDTAYLAQGCPRMVTLLREFSHGMQINQTETHAKAAYDPFVVADDRHYVHRFHLDHPRALMGLGDPAGARVLLQRFEELWGNSLPAISATTLGL